MVSSGLHERVLVVGAEVISRFPGLGGPATAILFGDGAGAAFSSPPTGSGRILGFDLGNDGSGGSLLRCPPAVPASPPVTRPSTLRLHFIEMNGREVYRFATRIIHLSATRRPRALRLRRGRP